MKCSLNIFLLIFVLSIIPYSNSQNQKFNHVEPSNWWSGMEHSEVEILFHKDNIREYDVTCEGLNILKTRKTENPNFLFVTVDTENKSPGFYKLVFQSSAKKSKKKLSYDFELKKRREDSRLRKGFDQSDVIYLIMPDRFSNGNPDNDSDESLYEKMDRGNPGGRHGGDIEGIINHLDYIHELGATAIWTTPLMEDNDSTYSYHTYAQSDVYKIDPRFGSNQDYVNLVKYAHEKGIKIIQDVVTNHWGYMHWMMFDTPTKDWFHQFPEFTQSNFRMTTHMDPYMSEIDYKVCTDGWFVKTMPDLNQDNPLVLNYLIQNSIWWVETADLDGIRVDTYSFNSKEGISKWTHAMMKEYPNFSIVGEVWMLDQAQIAFWQKESPVAAIQDYNSGLPYLMDFTLMDGLSKCFEEPEQGWNKGMLRIYDNFINDFLYANPKNLCVFFENHDTERFNERFPNIEDYKLAMTLISTTRGVPQIYYGSEIGMQGKRNYGDGDIRRDFPGGWKEDERNAFDSAQRTEKENHYFEFTKNLLNWRKNKKVIHQGKMIHYVPEQNVYVYFRFDSEETVMVIINNSPENRTLNLSRFKENISTHKLAYDVLTNQTFDIEISKTFEVNGKTSYVLELR